MTVNRPVCPDGDAIGAGFQELFVTFITPEQQDKVEQALATVLQSVA